MRSGAREGRVPGPTSRETGDEAMATESPLTFALEASTEYGARVAAHMGTALAAHEERGFEDGEHKARPLVNVRRRDVTVIHSLYGDAAQTVNDKLCRLLFFVGALRDASAASITVVAPYLCYARKDRKTKARDPVTTRYTAALLEAVGADRVVTVDVHNLAAFQNAFRCPTDHLEAKGLFVDHFARQIGAGDDVIVISPDVGGTKRAEAFRSVLADALQRPVTSGFMEKGRSRGVVSGDTLVAEVEGRTAIIIDDLISTGTTILRTAKAAREKGATKVYAAATHGLFMKGSAEVVADPAVDRFVVTDTVPPFRLPADLRDARLDVLDSAPLVGEAIKRIQNGGSLVELLGTEG
jgi:ribose-phosphate pyrophosphokinase